MNKQEAFDKVVTHLRNQNKQAHDPVGRCVYRGANNTKCAFGCLIEDDEYKPWMEGISAYDLIMDNIFLDKFSSYSEMISELQDVHDMCYVIDWEKNFKDIATKYDLIL